MTSIQFRELLLQVFDNYNNRTDDRHRHTVSKKDEEYVFRSCLEDVGIQEICKANETKQYKQKKAEQFSRMTTLSISQDEGRTGFIHHPNGKQASPDFHILYATCTHTVIVKVEIKTGNNNKVMLKDGYFQSNVIYVLCLQRNKRTPLKIIAMGGDIPSKDDIEHVRMARYVKHISNNLIKQNKAQYGHLSCTNTLRNVGGYTLSSSLLSMSQEALCRNIERHLLEMDNPEYHHEDSIRPNDHTLLDLKLKQAILRRFLDNLMDDNHDDTEEEEPRWENVYEDDSENEENV